MKLSEKVFCIDNAVQEAQVGLIQCRFDEELLEMSLKDIVKKSTGDEDILMTYSNENEPDFCPVFLVAREYQDTSG